MPSPAHSGDVPSHHAAVILFAALNGAALPPPTSGVYLALATNVIWRCSAESTTSSVCTLLLSPSLGELSSLHVA